MSRRSLRIQVKAEPASGESSEDAGTERSPKKRKRVVVKAESDTKHSESSESESETPKNSKKMALEISSPVIESPKSSPIKNKENTAISAYERQIQQNIEDRKKMFEELRLGEAKELFSQVVPLVTSHKPSQRGERRNKKMKYDEPLRMSLRTRNKTAGEPTEFVELKDTGDKAPVAKPVAVRRSGPLTLSKTYTHQDAVADSTRFIDELIPLLEKEGELEKLPHDEQDFLKLMNTFSVSETGVAKAVTNRIYSLAWHPGTCKMLLASGDRAGSIGLWDVDQVDDVNHGVRVYDVHSAPVNCLTFDKFNSARLLSTSYDGFVRCLDFHTGVFEEVYSFTTSSKFWTAYHAQRDPSTLIVSQSDGQVVVVDTRTTPGKVQSRIQCFEASARTLSFHPMDENLFLTCNRYGEMGVFDLRHGHRGSRDQEPVTPVVAFPQTSKKGIHGAFYSPITGKYALTTSLENNLKIFDMQNHSDSADRCIKTIAHNNFTGRWLTPFKAVWHPQREDIFVVGSMEHPRRIELFGAPSGRLLHNFKSEWLNSVCSINAFHPTVPILAGGNSSGRVHIFRP